MFKKYFSCIKKSFVAFVLAAMCVVPLFGNSMVKASAASYPSLVIHTSRLTKSEVSGTYAGDVKIEVSLSSPRAVTSIGLKVQIGNGLGFRTNSSGNVICRGPFTFSQNRTSSNSLGVAGAGSGSGDSSDTVIVTLYAYKTNSLNSYNGTVSVGVRMLADNNGNSIKLSNVEVGNENSQTNVTSSTGYKLGDVNGDNSVDSKDATVIKRTLQSKVMSMISVYEVANNLSSWFPQAKAAEAVDANADKIVSYADSDAILDYYAKYIADTYTGNIGKSFYTIKAV
ncbi:MAG: dockerin type I domain-containing protein [Oscillospiraceae bacterium]|nr:dockerin type I domain-containing protein [Oscillospiraceae bacterium]